MAKTHILNGDALLAQLPDTISGKRIIMRECLMDGPVEMPSFAAFYKKRWSFLKELSGEFPFEEYEEKTISQIEAIKNLSANDSVYHWFEEDLFCQINLWFCLYILHEHSSLNQVFLVKPDQRSPYSFSFYNNQQLEDLYAEHQTIADLAPWSDLWKAFQNKDWLALKKLGASLNPQYSFLMPAIKAQLERLESETSYGRPLDKVMELVAEGKSFPEVFRSIYKSEAIYGFGDLQVKRLYDLARSTNK